MRLIAAAGFVVLLALAPPAVAHDNGRLQLFLRRLDVVPAGDDTWLLNVTLIDADSGRPVPGMDVTARAAGGPAPAAGPVRLDDTGRGDYSGRLALASGPWTITVRADPVPGGEPAVPLEQSSRVTLQARSGADPPASVAPDPVPLEAIGIPAGGSLAEAGFRWGHTLVAIGWVVGVGLLTLLALPRGRSLLSDHAVTVLDGRLGSIARTTWFLAGMAVLTGAIELARWAPYEVPLSSERAERLFVLPWAKPYFLVLAVKLGAYAGLIALSVPLMRQARRQAAAWVEPGGGHRSDDRPPVWLRLAPAGVLAAVATLTLMVTLLLYFHRMSEARLG